MLGGIYAAIHYDASVRQYSILVSLHNVGVCSENQILTIVNKIIIKLNHNTVIWLISILHEYMYRRTKLFMQNVDI